MIISVVGSGGKTSKIKELKEQYLKENKTVLMCTTTHMLIEEDTLLNPTYEQIEQRIKENGYCFAGNQVDDKKIGSLDKDVLNKCKENIDVILIEADGSKHKYLKYCLDNEPVIDEDSDKVILITNLKGLNHKAKDVIHRYEYIYDSDQIVDAKIIQDLVRLYLNKITQPVSICVNGANSLYERCLKSLLEKNIDVDILKKEWFQTASKLVLFGAGHVSQYVNKIAKLLDFYTIVIDEREEFANRDCFPNANEIHCVPFNECEKILPKEENTCFVIVTRGHKDDKECLELVLRRPHLYCGMIGSKGKVQKTFDALNLDEQTRQNIHAPIGLKIKANTPAEIAISILAQIIDIKNQKYSSFIPSELYNSKEKGMLCIIIDKKGSTPRGIGTMMLVCQSHIVSTIGGGQIEYEVIQRARKLRDVSIETFVLDNEQASSLGMICGGQNTILFIPV